METIQRVLKHTKYINNSIFNFIQDNNCLIKMILYGLILVVGLITSIVSFFKKDKLLNLVRVVLYCFIAVFLNYVAFFLKFALNKLSPKTQLDNVINFSNWIIVIILVILIVKNLIVDEPQSETITDDQTGTDKIVDKTTFVSKIAGFFAFLFIISLMVVIISIDYFDILKNMESDSVLIGLLFIIICVCRLNNFELFTLYIALVIFVSFIIILIQFIQRNHIKKVLSK